VGAWPGLGEDGASKLPRWPRNASPLRAENIDMRFGRTSSGETNDAWLGQTVDAPSPPNPAHAWRQHGRGEWKESGHKGVSVI